MSPVHKALALAQRQGGVVTRAQLGDVRVGRRTIERFVSDGVWQRLDRSTVLTTPSRPSWDAYLWNAYLDDDCAVYGRTAAYLLGLDDDQSLPVQIAIDRSRRATKRVNAIYRRIDLTARQFRSLSGLRCVGLEDTVLDLCNEGTPHDVVAWITAVGQRRLTTPEKLLLALHRRPRIRHRALIEAVIREAAGGVHSVLEYQYADRVERPHGLPSGTPQAHPATESGAVDKWYEEYGLVVELDGLKWHTESFRDRARDNANTRSGQSSLRYGSRELFGDACGVAREVGGLLLQRTWPGPFISCPSCP
ncbi:type IV toxin-antitoxin system AbiEi family antitoxin domain-containing protein [Antricoccus suffuscus]|nr:type IV toxin-antitoxin system AbiEi family antitoxin domain-containing protein [Antricoccus suffuscus]